MSVDPRGRHAIELATRAQRLPLSVFMANAAIEAASRVALPDGRTVAEAVDQTYDPDERERLLNVAATLPHLLTYEEQQRMKVIEAAREYWLSRKSGSLVATTRETEAESRPWILENWDRIEAIFQQVQEDGFKGRYDFSGFAPVNPPPKPSKLVAKPSR